LNEGGGSFLSSFDWFSGGFGFSCFTCSGFRIRSGFGSRRFSYTSSGLLLGLGGFSSGFGLNCLIVSFFLRFICCFYRLLFVGIRFLFGLLCFFFLGVSFFLYLFLLFFFSSGFFLGFGSLGFFLLVVLLIIFLLGFFLFVISLLGFFLLLFLLIISLGWSGIRFLGIFLGSGGTSSFGGFLSLLGIPDNIIRIRESNFSLSSFLNFVFSSLDRGMWIWVGVIMFVVGTSWNSWSNGFFESWV
jgi:hypothetical protein